MGPRDPNDADAVIAAIRDGAARQALRITQHAAQEMAEDELTVDQLLEVLSGPLLLENYPQHRRGSCCLVLGHTAAGRPIHVVCTTALPLLIIVTVYEPKPPKWVSPTQRSARP